MARIRKNKTKTSKVDVAKISEISEMSERVKRVAEFGWMATQSEEIKVEIMAKYGDLLAIKCLPDEPVSPEFSFGLLLLAAKIIRKKEMAMQRKAKLSTKESDEIERKNLDGFQENLEAKKNKKKPKKAARIINQFFELISLMRDERGMSWGDVSLYLHRHQLVASRAYIQRVYEQHKKELADAA